jgi:hypothetical protein
MRPPQCWEKNQQRNSGGIVCYNCLVQGHMRRSCTSPIRCLSCYNYGHVSRACLAKRRTRFYRPKTNPLSFRSSVPLKQELPTCPVTLHVRRLNPLGPRRRRQSTLPSSQQWRITLWIRTLWSRVGSSSATAPRRTLPSECSPSSAPPSVASTSTSPSLCWIHQSTQWTTRMSPTPSAASW